MNYLGRKNSGLKGFLKVKNIANIRIAYVPQNNHLNENLTVLETLTFAFKLNKSNLKADEKKIENIIDEFGLNNIKDNSVGRCSGGQQKRISIALELFSNPNLLILDEPTTGLDSTSCALVVKLLRDLVLDSKYPMAILATIHQPSWAVFCEFNRVYIINSKGENLYLGKPQKILSLLDKVNLSCDNFNSPSDYIIEIAAEDYGFDSMRLVQKEFRVPILNEDELEKLEELSKVWFIRKAPIIQSIIILMQRVALVTKRNLLMSLLRITTIIFFSMFVSATFGHTIGYTSGCPLRKYQLYSLSLDRLGMFVEDQVLRLLQNNCCLFFGLIVGMISGMTATILEFPREMHILMKEYNNGWYSCFSYYIAKNIVDLPMQVNLFVINNNQQNK